MFMVRSADILHYVTLCTAHVVLQEFVIFMSFLLTLVSILQVQLVL